MSGDLKNLPRFNGRIQEFDDDVVVFPAREGFEPVTLGDLTATVAQYMLASIHGKNAVKETQVRQMTRCDDTTWNCILKDTNKRLRNSCGLAIVKDQGNLYVCNVLPAAPGTSSKCEWEDARRGLLHIILAFILMEQHPCAGSDFGKTSSDSLWKFLDSLGFDSDRSDENLGNISQLIQQFVKEGWLASSKDVKSRQEQSGPVFYEWGGKALGTISPQMIYDMFLEISNENADEWRSHTEKIADLQYRFYQQFRQEIGKKPPGGMGTELGTTDVGAEKSQAKTQSQQGQSQTQSEK
ncbi:unnamed protein product, partial [Mesorhabditis belari]|uniref:MAGE domain-containing protein n=1 Tax=Mesorhabditis belari TaxID=2138241 RepID=A0AAF3FCI6_9BILA